MQYVIPVIFCELIVCMVMIPITAIMHNNNLINNHYRRVPDILQVCSAAVIVSHFLCFPCMVLLWCDKVDRKINDMIWYVIVCLSEAYYYKVFLAIGRGILKQSVPSNWQSLMNRKCSQHFPSHMNTKCSQHLSESY